MIKRTSLNKEELENRFVFDVERGEICYRIKIKANNAGDVAGTKRSDGYTRIRIGRKAYFAHRLIYFIATGTQPEYLDHKNGDKSDNRISNLRVATNSENMCNHQKRAPQGIYLRFKKWHGRVMKDYRTHRITPTRDKEEAMRRMIELRQSLHGRFASC